MAATSQPTLFDHTPDREPKAEPLDILALATLRGLGFQGIRCLTEHFERLSDVWGSSEEEIHDVLQAGRVPSAEDVARTVASQGGEIRSKAAVELDKLSARQITIITRSAPQFPARLKDVRPPVYWLFVEGDPVALAANNTVAVVGSRKASQWGKRTATRVSSWLVRRGITIVSGLAEGIDEAAHEVAVDAGRPTVAVLGHGLSIAFPAATARLRQEIIKANGAVVTEYLLNDRYDRAKFISRNRILAGLGRALVPVEGEYASGTARAVRYAHEFGRHVVGVRANNARELGIYRLLTELGAPIIDLSSPDANAQFAGILSEAFQSTVPIEAQTGVTDVLARIVDQFQQLADKYEITEEDLNVLMDKLRAVLKRRSRQHDD